MTQGTKSTDDRMRKPQLMARASERLFTSARLGLWNICRCGGATPLLGTANLGIPSGIQKGS